jgi:hypothetical protein
MALDSIQMDKNLFFLVEITTLLAGPSFANQPL